jgi:hypothetical protein
MQILTENMSVDELGAEIRRLTPLIRGLTIVHEPTDEELRATVHLRIAAEWNELSDLACSYQKGDVMPKRLSRFIRNLYSNYTWPSPLPRLMVLELGLTTDKRIKHVEAINLLARRLRCTPFEFISKERREVGEHLFPLGYNNWRGARKILYR